MTDFRGAAAADGTIALVDSYQQDRQGFRLAWPDAKVSDRIADGWDAYNLTVVDAHRALWPQVSQWGTYGLDAKPVWLPGSGRACWCEVAGVPHLVHWLEGVGLVARRADSARGRILSPEPREFHYDAVPWQGGIRIAWATADGEPPGSLVIEQWDCQSGIVDLVPAAVQPTFSFNHDVTVAVFKDPDGITAAPVEVLVNENRQRASRPVFVADDTLATGKWNGELYGVYSEARGDALPKALALAAGLKTRLLVCHDKQEPWTLPAGLRPWDVPAIELYRFKVPVEETLQQALGRWRHDRDAMLAAWPGDCAVVPMFYCMGGAAGGNPPELWPVSVPLETLGYLSEIVNSSPRIKLILPFEYLRANGIVAHGELQQAYDSLLAAAPVPAVLLPVGGAPVPPKPVPPLPTSPYLHHKGVQMNIDGKTVVLRGPGGLLMRPDAPNTGTWGGLNRGWRGAIFDGHDKNDARYHHHAAAIGSHYTFKHVGNNGFAGADSGEHSPALDKQYYYTPDNSDAGVAGDLEQFRVYDGNENGALQAQTELKTTAEHPSGAGHPFFAHGVAVEVV